MINRTKLAALASCAALAAALLTGCGGSSSSAAPSSVSTASVSAPASSAAASADTTENGSDALDAAYNTLLQANPISNQFEIAAMNIEYDFGLPADDVVSYKGVKSNDNGDAGLVLVLETADGKAQAQTNVQNAIVSSNGSRVVMVIASNECTADLSGAVDSALNG